MESFKEHLGFLKQVAAKFRIDLVEMLHRAESGHLGGSLSALEMMVALYFGELPRGEIMKYDPAKPGWEGQDYFVLSKGHASPTWYVILANVGFFDMEELRYFRQMNSLLQPYPSKKIPGIVLPGGAPGYGFSAAVGLAMALKMEKQPNRVYVLVGDGELQEGQVWESALMAAQHRLDNLTLLVDWNGLQTDGPLRGVVGVEPIVEKFEAFGWKTIPVSDGHDFEDLLIGLERALETQRRPSVIVAKTIKGRGVPFAENRASYHAEVLSAEELDEALPKLKSDLAILTSQQ